MKKVTFKKYQDRSVNSKSVTITSHNIDKKCETFVSKNFVYQITPTESIEATVEPPEIRIIKNIDTKNQIEELNFQVKGSFYMNHNRMIVQVNFHHTLNIVLKWRQKIFSPKKSEVLTK